MSAQIPYYSIGLGPKAGRLVGETQIPIFRLLDASALARFHVSHPKAISIARYVWFEWLSERRGARPVIFITTPYEIAVLDAWKELDKKNEPDMSLFTRIGPGKAVVKQFDGMRHMDYLFQTTTLSKAGIDSLIVGASHRDVKLRKDEPARRARRARDLEGEEEADPGELDDGSEEILHFDELDYVRLDLRLQGFEQVARLLDREYPGCDKRFYFRGAYLAQRFSMLPHNPILHPVRLREEADTWWMDDLEADLATTPRPSPPFEEPVKHSVSHERQFRYTDLVFPANAKDSFSMDPDFEAMYEVPAKLKVRKHCGVWVMPDTNFATRCAGPLERLIDRVKGGIKVASSPEVRREVQAMEDETSGKRLRRKIEGNLGLLTGSKAKLFKSNRLLPRPVVALMPNSSPIPGKLEKDLLIRSEVLAVLEALAKAHPSTEVVLLVPTLDRGCAAILKTIPPVAGTTLIVLLLENHRDGSKVEKILYNSLYPWVVTVE